MSAARIFYHGVPAKLIGSVCEVPDDAPMSAVRTDIDEHFAAPSVEAILASLTTNGSDWCLKTAETIKSKSPLSTRVTFDQIRAGSALDFRDCMEMEFRLTNRFMAAPDFYEGVRAVVIEKDQVPKWQPATLADVNDGQVKAYFAPLGDAELIL